jgi:uncharacterized membrane protein YgcG
MNDIFDILEICLQEIESGAEMETVLARYPQFAAELRPILKVSVVARTRGSAVSDPSPEAARRGRTKFLQHAAQIREAKISPRKRVIPVFQRLAIAFTLTALFLTSGTGLVSASSSALPGENLYPVKLTWENVRLFFAFDEEGREALENTFENERLHEVNELLVEGRDETIQFAGLYMEVNGITYVAGIHIVILDTSVLPVQPLSDGAAVVVTGHTNAEGFVDVESIELLPEGTVVPVGEPIEVEESHNAVDSGVKDSGIDENKDEATKSNDNIDDHGDDGSGDDRVNINDNQNDNSGTDGGSNDNNNDDGSDDGGNSGSGGDDGGGGDNSGGGGDSGGDDD